MLKKNSERLFKYVILISISILILFPVIYMFTNSFMSTQEIIDYYGSTNELLEKNYINIHLIPEQITLNQYYNVFFRNPEFLVKFWNSVILVVPILICQIIFILPAAFAFAKLKLPYKKQLFYLLLVLMLMPYQVTLVPNYIILKKFNLLGENLAIILPNIFSAMSMILLTQCIKNISDEQINSARIDGANNFIILIKIIMPQAKGGIITMIIIAFAECWNMVEQPIIFLQDKAKYPLSTYLSIINTNEIGLAFACGFIYMIPAIIIFLFGEKSLLEGMKYFEIK